MPFMDTLVKPEQDRTLSISVYRKPTQRDQYLHWNNHHDMSAKYGIISTITHRCRVACFTPELHSIESGYLWTV